MPFNELVKGKILPDPKAREPEDLKRVPKGKKKTSFGKGRSSVSARTIKWTLVALGILFVAALVAGIGWLIMSGFQAYITN